MSDCADDTFLTDAELGRLTGSTWRSIQIRWLRDRAYPFEVNAAGRPVVLRSVVLERLGGRQAPRRRPGPDFGALRRDGTKAH